jgi:hypothetical protein
VKPYSSDCNQNGAKNQSTHSTLPYGVTYFNHRTALFQEGFAVSGKEFRSRQSVGRWVGVPEVRSRAARHKRGGGRRLSKKNPPLATGPSLGRNGKVSAIRGSVCRDSHTERETLLTSALAVAPPGYDGHFLLENDQRPTGERCCSKVSLRFCFSPRSQSF